MKTVVLAGNPNVGKSTLFNGLTGLKQHTGNWTGKTVSTAAGDCTWGDVSYHFVDLPGTYSLLAHSAEEEVARDVLCSGTYDAAVVVCDAGCLERNLNLVLQVAELAPRVLVCLNLTDEAERRGVHVNTHRLSAALGMPVVATVAHRKDSLRQLLGALDTLLSSPPAASPPLHYPVAVESAIAKQQRTRWEALRMLEQYGDEDITPAQVEDAVVGTLYRRAAEIASAAVTCDNTAPDATDRRLDRILTGKRFGIPLMLLLLVGIFWITVVGANTPSALLSDALLYLEDRLCAVCTAWHIPDWLHGSLVHGAYAVLARVVAVMLPPMAIFFPLFTLLEDAGYLPRIAYNLDRPFQRCHACGKQALTMCMGLGCNAVGVTGCRIIDSPRERLLAVLTNTLVPCNGRFPTLITLLTLFVAGGAGGLGSSLLSAVLLTAVLLFSVLLTFAVTRLLSATLLRGTPSAFTLELPPYRRPRVGRVLADSLVNRTLHVLGRAVTVAAPAGLVLWCLANITVTGDTLLTHAADFLQPLGALMGLDGAILLAFILGFPANELVLPILLTIYLSTGTITDTLGLDAMRQLFLDRGWTVGTAVCMLLFSLVHFPCSTTLLTIRRETGSRLWTAVAFWLPTLLGTVLCMLVNLVIQAL